MPSSTLPAPGRALRRLALLAFAFALAAPSTALAAPTLRTSAVVHGPVIRVGDIFAGAGTEADVALAAAPPPGGRVVFDAVWLAAEARAQKLDWQPSSRFDRVTVERASDIIPEEAIAAAFRRALGDRLPQGETRIELDNKALRLFVPAGGSTELALDGVSFDARSGRFSGFVTPAADPHAEPVRVTGRVSRIIELPVLTRPMAPGETIAAGDIEMIQLRSDRAGEGYATLPDELVGRTPRRPLRAGEPIRPSDVRRPLLIHKGDLVTLVLETPALRITAQGKALENGAEGAAIRIGNTRSGRVIDAVVTGPGLAAVASVARLAAQK